jgi:hypothetical protein
LCRPGTFEDSFDVDCGTFLPHDQITIDFRDTFFLDAGSVVIHGPHEVAAAGDDLAPLFCRHSPIPRTGSRPHIGR